MIYNSNGEPYKVEGHELAVESNAKGDTKVDSLGHLTGGRAYRVRTFVVPSRENKLFMLAHEAAHCVGLADGYALFRTHPRLHKVVLTKQDHPDYAGQAALTALSVFREFGPLVVVGGRRVSDDYYEEEAQLKYPFDELADPHDRLPPPGEPYNVEQWSSVQPDTPLPQAMHNETWLYQHASAASRYNTYLGRQRANLWGPAGVYEGHTGLNFYASDTQPSRPRWSRRSRNANGRVEVSTVLASRNRITSTGLSKVDPAIYAGLDKDMMQAIYEQIELEQTAQKTV